VIVDSVLAIRKGLTEKSAKGEREKEKGWRPEDVARRVQETNVIVEE
jgi:hypothetical protein